MDYRQPTLQLTLQTKGGGCDCVTKGDCVRCDYPAWPESAIAGRRELDSVLHNFSVVSVSVPLDAATNPRSRWQAWVDGGFEAHKFIHGAISRQTYPEGLSCLQSVWMGCQEAYPDLWAVLRFIPKKNGLQQELARLQRDGVDAVSLTHLSPHQARRRLDNLRRAFAQSWALLSCYLSQPPAVRDDLLWAARTLTERVHTGQRSHALEILCLGIFGRGSALGPLIGSTAREATPTAEEEARLGTVVPFTYPEYVAWRRRASERRGERGGASGLQSEAGDARRGPSRLRDAFTAHYSGEDPRVATALGKRGWERSRLAFPFAEVAWRAWRHRAAAAVTETRGGVGAAPTLPETMSHLLIRIGHAAPDGAGLHAMLYWLLDLLVSETSLARELSPSPRWAPEPFLLRTAGAEARLVAALERIGHELEMLARASAVPPSSPAGDEGQPCSSLPVLPPALEHGGALLQMLRQTQTTATLLSTLHLACERRGERPLARGVVQRYLNRLATPGLALWEFHALLDAAIAETLDVETETVASCRTTVDDALAEWRRPELLFRYLETHSTCARMGPITRRWLRALLGLSNETLRQIRREAPANVRHLRRLPERTVLRWFAEGCPGTSRPTVLFLLGEEARSCLKIISDADGGRYNCALMGYALQSHVRALVVSNAAGAIGARALVRLLIRSDTLTPILFCDPIFYTAGPSPALHARMLEEARRLERHMRVPVVHAGSILPVLDAPSAPSAPASRGEQGGGHRARDARGAQHARSAPGAAHSAHSALGAAHSADGTGTGDADGRWHAHSAEGGYVRRVARLGHDVIWVDLVEMDGVSPFTYSEEMAYDQLLEQHTSGVQERTAQCPVVVVAALPRADSPSAERYASESRGPLAWATEASVDGADRGAAQREASDVGCDEADHKEWSFVSHPFNPATARARDLSATELARRAHHWTGMGEFQASLIARLLRGGRQHGPR